MEPIYIPQLTKAPEKKEVIQIEEFLPTLETLTPVRGHLTVKHCGNFLEVSVQAETIVTLTCHRCLQQYNHRLSIDTSEMIWLNESANQPEKGPLEKETPLEDLLETLPPQGYFEPELWLYEQLCLSLPPRQLCDRKCPGIPPTSNSSWEASSDGRWDALEMLKRQLSN